MRGLLEQKRLLLKSGTIVDATIIDAPPSTTNKAKARDPEMRQGRKNEREWHFGMKAHVGTDPQGIGHTLVTTPANASDISQLGTCCTGMNASCMGTRSIGPRCIASPPGLRGVRYHINRRPSRYTPLSAHQRQINCLRSVTRACGEHAFHVVGRLWGFTKVRYRGLAKDGTRLFAAFALANLYPLRRQLLPPQWACAS